VVVDGRETAMQRQSIHSKTAADGRRLSNPWVAQSRIYCISHYTGQPVLACTSELRTAGFCWNSFYMLQLMASSTL